MVQFYGARSLNRSTNNLFRKLFFNKFIHRELLFRIVLAEAILLRASVSPTRSARVGGKNRTRRECLSIKNSEEPNVFQKVTFNQLLGDFSASADGGGISKQLT